MLDHICRITLWFGASDTKKIQLIKCINVTYFYKPNKWFGTNWVQHLLGKFGALNKKKSTAGEFYSCKKEFSPYSSVMRNSPKQRKPIYKGSHHIFITLSSGRNTLTLHRLTQFKRIYLANRVIMSYWSRQKTGQFNSLQFNLYSTESQQLKG